MSTTSSPTGSSTRRSTPDAPRRRDLTSGEWHVLGKRLAHAQRTPFRRRARGQGRAVERGDDESARPAREGGVVRRIPDEHDRRSVQVEVTKEGKELYERAVGAQAAKEGIVAEALDTQQQDALNDLLRRLMLAFERREAQA